MVEEFTFPSCIQPEQRGGASKGLSFPQFASPPPWFFVSVPGAEDAAAQDRHRRCFSAVEKATKANDDGRYYIHGGGGSERFAVAEQQHKMDMLWEDFNEELARAPPPCPLSKEWASEAWLPGDETRAATRDAAAGLSVVHGVVRRRRLSLLVMLKLLRKLFLARKSTSRKTPPT